MPDRIDHDSPKEAVLNPHYEELVANQKRAEEALRINQAFMVSMAETLPFMSVVYDLVQHRVLYVSRAYREFYGITEQQAIEQGTAGILRPIHPEHVPLVVEYLNQRFSDALQDPDPIIEYRAQNANGEWRWLLLRTVTLSTQPNGLPHQVIGLGTDVNSRKQLEEVERQQRRASETLWEVGTLLSSTLDQDEILDLAMDTLERIAPYDGALIRVFQGTDMPLTRFRGSLQREAAAAWVRSERRVEFDREVLQTIHRTRQPFLIPDLQVNPAWSDLPGLDLARTFLNVPIYMAGEMIGSMHLGNKTPASFSILHVEHTQRFADQLAIALQNARIHHQSQELTATRERQRIARELHDSVTQTLFAANVIAQTLPRLIEAQPEQLKTNLDELAQLTSGALAEMRTLLVELRPNALHSDNLAGLLQHLVDALAARTGIEPRVTLSSRLSLPPEVQGVFYRVTQEALNNIAKYAQASHLTLDLTTTDDSAELSIEDDGIGFDTHLIPADHFGLRIMAERAASIDAVFMLNSTMGKGTQIGLKWQRTS